MKPADKIINVSTNKFYVKSLIIFIDNNDKKKWINQLYDKKKFIFIYNGVNNKNPNSGYNVEKFCQKHKVALKFTSHAINFKMISKPDQTFNYNFKLQCFYLVEGKRTTIFTLNRRKKKPDEWLIFPPCTNKTKFHLN